MLIRREIVALLCVLIGCSAMNSHAGWWADWRKKQYEGYTKFHEAAKAGDVESLKRYLEQGADIDQQSRSAQCTALGCAVRWKKHKTAKFLLENGADPRIPFRIASIKHTPFQMAARIGDEQMVRVFLPYLDDVDEGMEKFPTRNRTAFSWACSEGNMELAKLLLSHGADINVRNFNGVGTPLIIAVRNLHIDMVQFLLEHGADPSITDYLRDLSALEWGEAMAEGKFVRIPTPRGRTPTQEELRLAREKYDEVMAMLKAWRSSSKSPHPATTTAKP